MVYEFIFLFKKIFRPALLLIAVLCISLQTNAQNDVKQIRKGNQHFEDGEFNQSEVLYRKALETNQQSLKARFNLADALYKQGRYDESSNLLSDIAATTNDPEILSGVYHNMGNSLLKQQKLQESVDAYKKSLLLNPADEQTRYNLAYAQSMLKNQQNQQNKQGDKNQKNKDQNKQDQNKKQQNKDNKKDQQDQQNKQDQQDQQNQQSKQDQNKQQQDKQGLSKEEAERLLQAAMNEEKDTRDKMNQQQFKAKKMKTTKAW